MMNRRQAIIAVCVAPPLLAAIGRKSGQPSVSRPPLPPFAVLRVQLNDIGQSDADLYLNPLFQRAAASFRSSGRRVRIILPRARIRLSSPLLLPDGVDLTGGGTSTVLDISTAPMAPAIVVRNTHGTQITDLSVRGSGRGSQPLNVTRPDVATLVNSGSGVIYLGVTGGAIRRVSVHNFGGISGKPPFNGVAGVWLTAGCKNCIVQDCDVSECRNGINEDNFFQVDPVGNKIIRNKVANCRFGIALDSGASAYGTIVEDNIVSDCLQSGIDLNKSIKCVVRRNQIYDCGFETGNSGIFIYGSQRFIARDNIVEQNTVLRCGGSGIRSGPYSRGNLIVENIIEDNQRYGIHTIGGTNTLKSNHLRRNRLAPYG